MTGTERKVFQKYYPPDFDPSKIPRAKGGRNRQFVQRVMSPYNMQCNTCHEYIYKGKKFNMRRETVEGDDYLGLRLFRFYFRCPNCLAEITFKTDLENCDYSQEHGATRLFEAVKLYQEQAKAEEKQDEEDATNPMKMLEKRTKMSRTEMESLAKLEELRELNRRHAAFDQDGVISSWGPDHQARAVREQEEHDEQFIKSIFGKPDEDGKRIKRLRDDDEDDAPSTSKAKMDELADFATSSILPKKASKKPPDLKAKSNAQKILLGGIVKVKCKSNPVPVVTQLNDDKPEGSGNGLSLLGGYGSGASSSGNESN